MISTTIFWFSDFYFLFLCFSGNLQHGCGSDILLPIDLRTL